MPAPIVYDGVVGSNGGGGSLFEGASFWLATRLPVRERLIAAIQQNGGTIASLEKDADILVADPAFPKRAPQNYKSYSWKFIDDAIKTGVVPDREHYLIHRPGAGSRPVGSKNSAKGTKTIFTKEDDEILTHWVKKAVRKCSHSIKGNTLYEELAEVNPRHTPQSWRARWVKHLSLLPQNQGILLGEDRFSLPSSPPAAPAVNLQTLSKAKTETRVEQPKVSGTDDSKLKPLRAQFTAEEDKRLLKMVFEADRAGETIGGKKLYHDFAKNNPSHTGEAWRSRYMRTLAPRLNLTPPVQSSSRQDEPSPAPSAGGTNANGALLLQTQGRRNRTDRGLGREARERAAPQQEAREQEEREQEAREQEAREERARDDERRMQHETAAAASHIWRIWQGYKVRKGLKALTKLQTLAKSFVGKKRFLEALDIYMEVMLDDQINPDPEVEGRTISLWDLFRAVDAQSRDPDECDWAMVAEELGFDWTANRKVPSRLAECYDSHLRDFVGSWMKAKARSPFEQATEDKEEMEEGEDEQDTVLQLGDDPAPTGDIRDTPISDGSGPESPLPSSPPAVASSKRPYEDFSELDSSLIPGYPRKRVRFDPNAEIPSTPSDTAGRTPRHGRLRGPERSPPRRIQARSPQRPLRMRLPLPHAPEPETQDWRFDPETQTVGLPPPQHGSEPETQDWRLNLDTQVEYAEDEQNSGLDITPSQQLTNESAQVSPIPINLPSTKKPAPSPASSCQTHLHLPSTALPPAVSWQSSSTLRPPNEARAYQRPGTTDGGEAGGLKKKTEKSVSPLLHQSLSASVRGPGHKPGAEVPLPRLVRRTLPASLGRPLQKERGPSQPQPPSSSAGRSLFSKPFHSRRLNVEQPVGAQTRPARAPPEAPNSAGRLFTSSQQLSTDNRRAPQLDAQSKTAIPQAQEAKRLTSASKEKEERRTRPPATDTPSAFGKASPTVPINGTPPNPRAASSVTSDSEQQWGLRLPANGRMTKEVERWESLGYPRKVIVDLFLATSMNIQVINEVLGDQGLLSQLNRSESPLLPSSFRLPEDKAGVWTERDDRGLRIVDGFTARRKAGGGSASSLSSSSNGTEKATRAEAERHRKRLEAKHGGSIALEIRREFLENEALKRQKAGRPRV